MRSGWLKPRDMISACFRIFQSWCPRVAVPVANCSRFQVRQQKRLCRWSCSVSVERRMLCSWLIEVDADRCQQVAGHHWPSTWGPDQIVTCTWYRPVWTALVDKLEASATGVMCTCHLAPVISQAVAFCTDCILRIKLSATPYISELQ